jgi:GNAT superfamily N-acetyltransferase
MSSLKEEHMLTIRELRSDGEIASAFPLMSMLRDRIRADTFVAEIRRQQLQGYELVGAFAADRLVALAGIRRSHTLSRGEHLFVDDLVTDARARGEGHGTQVIRWLAERAAAEGITRVYLDSRITAKGFYERLGFTFLTSIPCWLELPKSLAEHEARL